MPGPSRGLCVQPTLEHKDYPLQKSPDNQTAQEYQEFPKAVAHHDRDGASHVTHVANDADHEAAIRESLRGDEPAPPADGVAE